jgi:hypothetical protein
MAKPEPEEQQPVPQPAPDPDVESPSKNDDDEPLPPTPDVSDIHSHDDVLQAARAAAELKAMRVLKRGGKSEAAKSRAGGGRATSPKPAAAGRDQSSPSATWSFELKRREEETRARREALRQEKLEAQRRKMDDIERRTQELRRIRQEELELQRLHKREALHRPVTPVRGGHADPTVNALGKENMVGVVEKRFERAESSTRTRSASAKRLPAFDATSPRFASNWHTSRLIAPSDPLPGSKAFTPEKSSHGRRLNAEELKASVERLSARRGRSTTPKRNALAKATTNV